MLFFPLCSTLSSQIRFISTKMIAVILQGFTNKFNAYYTMNIDKLVRGHWDSRATLMPIYGDLYQIKLLVITNENHVVTHLGSRLGKMLTSSKWHILYQSMAIGTFLQFGCQF